MTRETKVGFMVAGSFLALVGGVLAVKYIRGDQKPDPTPTPAEMAQAPIELPPGLNLPKEPDKPLYGNDPPVPEAATTKPTPFTPPDGPSPVDATRLPPAGRDLSTPPPIDDVPGLKPIGPPKTSDDPLKKPSALTRPKVNRPDEDDDFNAPVPPLRSPVRNGVRQANHDEAPVPGAAPAPKTDKNDGPPPLELPKPDDKKPIVLPAPGGPPPLELPAPMGPARPGDLKLPSDPPPTTAPIDVPGFKPMAAIDVTKPMTGSPPPVDLVPPPGTPMPPAPPPDVKKEKDPLPMPGKVIDLPKPGDPMKTIDLPRDLPRTGAGGKPDDLPPPDGKKPPDLPGDPTIKPMKPIDPPPLPPEIRRTPEPVKPTDPPAAVLGPRPGPAAEEPRVDSYDEEWYYCKAGDSLEAISQKFFYSTKYEQALRQYNLDRNFNVIFRQDRASLPDRTVVKVPPARILERSYPTLIAGFKTAGNPRPAPAAPGAAADLGSPREYQVRKEGMTLRDIARDELRDANQWTRIFQLNRGLNPNEVIPVGTRIHMPGNP